MAWPWAFTEFSSLPDRLPEKDRCERRLFRAWIVTRLTPEPHAMLTPFHLAYHVTDLDEARAFYGGVLGCREGRSHGNLGRFRLLRPPDQPAPG